MEAKSWGWEKNKTKPVTSFLLAFLFGFFELELLMGQMNQMNPFKGNPSKLSE